MTGLVGIETIAQILQGEAGGMGYFGMLTVAATIATRRVHGQTWDRIAAEYYARAKPGETALYIADCLWQGDIPGGDAEFCLSDADVVKLRAKGMTIAVVYRVEHVPTGQALNLVRDWK